MPRDDLADRSAEARAWPQQDDCVGVPLTESNLQGATKMVGRADLLSDSVFAERRSSDRVCRGRIVLVVGRRPDLAGAVNNRDEL